MSKKSVLLLGGYDNGDYDLLKKLSLTKGTFEGWGSTKETKKNDEIWFYIQAPISAIVAVGKALSDADDGKYWKHETEVGSIRWIEDHIGLSELRDLFPKWGWTKRARGRTYLDQDKVNLLLKRVGQKPKLKSKRFLEDERRRVTAEIVSRRGQPAFRNSLILAYGRCVVTGCNAREALEAAHIDPYLGPKSNSVSNGFLFRSDLHTLFDLNLLKIDPNNWEVWLDRKLRKTTYAGLHGKKINLPKSKSDYPDIQALRDRWKVLAK